METSHPKIGGSGGTKQELTLKPGQYVTSISGKYEGKIDFLQMEAIGGNVISRGKKGEYDFAYQVPDCAEFIGFFGMAEHRIDALGILLRDK